MGMKIGNNYVIFRRADILYPMRILIGDNTYIRWFTHIDGRGKV